MSDENKKNDHIEGEDEYDPKDLTNEIANLIIGNAKIIAAKKTFMTIKPKR